MKRRGFPVPVVLLALLVALVLSGGAAVVAVVLTEQQKVRAALRRAAAKWGIDPDILDAIGYVESRWKLGAKVTTGTDGARGGAWGPTQITEKTAKAAGFTGNVADFTRDPDLAAEWTARIMLTRPGGAPTTIEDASAYWNAGKTSAASLGPTHVTRVKYIPAAEKAIALVQTSPLPEGAA